MWKRLGAFSRSSIGKKSLMSVTGLLLIGYLIVHVAGNLQLLTDPTGESFDSYAERLQKIPGLLLIELGLAGLFVAHIYLGLRTALENREARKVRYKELASHGRRSPASMSMVVTGVIVLVFLVIHVIDFRVKPAPDGLAAAVVRRLAAPAGALIYLVGVGALGLHLWHAFRSSLQTLGIRHPRYQPALRGLGYVLATGLAVGFAVFPIVLFLFPERFHVRSTETARGSPAAAEAQVDPGEIRAGARGER